MSSDFAIAVLYQRIVLLYIERTIAMEDEQAILKESAYEERFQ